MEIINKIKCNDSYTNRLIWNGIIIINDQTFEGIIDNDINITYINGQFLEDNIMFSLLKKNCNDEVYNMNKSSCINGTNYFEGISINIFNSQFKRTVALEEDNTLEVEKVKKLKKQIADYKKSIMFGK